MKSYQMLERLFVIFDHTRNIPCLSSRLSVAALCSLFWQKTQLGKGALWRFGAQVSKSGSSGNQAHIEILRFWVSYFVWAKRLFLRHRHICVYMYSHRKNQFYFIINNMNSQQKFGWHFLTQTRYSCVHTERQIFWCLKKNSLLTPFWLFLHIIQVLFLREVHLLTFIHF